MSSSRMKVAKGLVLGGVLCMLSGCMGEEGSSASLEKPATNKREPVVLEVQGKLYVHSDFDSYMTTIAGEAAPDLGPDTRSRLFDTFIEEKILLAEAHNRNVSLTQAEKRDFLAKLNLRFGGEEKPGSWDENETSSLFDRLLVEKLTVELVRDIVVTEEEVIAYYDQNKRDFLRPELVRVSQILLDREDQAIEVLESLKSANEADFRQKASNVSQGMEAARGGEMGAFELGQLPYEMEQVIFALTPGAISQVFESSYGFHIFRLDKKTEPELIPEEEAAVEIEVKILDQKITEYMLTYITSLKNRLSWTSHTQNLVFPYQRNQDV